jgi:PAT family beta-lactamase induction signal transducer AmpG
MLMVIVFVSQVASTFIVLPVGGLMAHTVADQAKGRAAGWYQAGNLGGTGIGGGAGVWLANHYSKEIAGGFLSLAMLVAALALFFVSDVRLVTTETIRQRLRLLGRDILSMLRSPILLFTIVLVMSPIGAGAMNNVWSAVAPDWRADPNTVAIGWVHDRFGTGWMLQTDALSAIVFVVVALFVLHKINAARAQGPRSG